MTTKGQQFLAIGDKRPILHSGMRGSLTSIAAVFFLSLAHSPQTFASELNSDSPLVNAKRAVVSNYVVLVSATYQDSVNAAKKLQSAVDSFLTEPSARTLDSAREAWRAARAPYCQTEAFRFYDGPIDQVEMMINAWPIDENYIDYVAENSEAGVINAVEKYPSLSRELILSLNEKEGKKNISTGFHAIEFLLWGQDRNASGPGDRSWRDYATGARNADRRRQYLGLITKLLVEHLETVAHAWVEGSGYRTEFLANPDAALGKILKGMGALSGPELAGERLTVPYETKEQEDEQSCFSDNTRDDLVNDAIGIRNIFFGHFTGADGHKTKGFGVHDLLQRVDAKFADKLSTQVEMAVAAAQSIPQPFDQAITGPNTAPGRMAVKKAIVAFQTQSDSFAHAAQVLSIKLDP